MTINDLKALCRLHKDDGRSSRISVPIVVVEQLCEQALQWQRLPEALKDYATEEAK